MFPHKLGNALVIHVRETLSTHSSALRSIRPFFPFGVIMVKFVQIRDRSKVSAVFYLSKLFSYELYPSPPG